MNILVINCGSSSLKFQLIDSESEQCIAKGLCERIGIEGSQITYTPAGGEKETKVTPMPDHTEAIRLVLEALTGEKSGVVKSLEEIGAVGRTRRREVCPVCDYRRRSAESHRGL